MSEHPAMTREKMTTTKALTLHQPWASLIACGAKTIETRSWSTSYRGPLAIHAAKATYTKTGRCVRGRATHGHPVYDAMRSVGLLVNDIIQPPLRPVVTGSIVVVVELVDIVPIVEAEWRWGQEHGADSIPDDGTPCMFVGVESGAVYCPTRGDHPFLELWRDDGDDWPTTRMTDQLPFGDFTPGRFAWLLDNVRPLDEPIAAKGRQGLWNLDDVLVRNLP